MNSEDWDKAGGIFCRRCHQETVRVFNGLCLSCHQGDDAKKAEDMEMKSKRRYIRAHLARGDISLREIRDL